MIIKSVTYTTQTKTLSLLASALFSLAGCGGASTTDTNYNAVKTTEPVSDWELVWSDEFDGSSIDPKKWSHEVNCDGGGNQEKQCYTDSPENSFVQGGLLTIVAKPDETTELPYTSARLVTQNKADWKYGRMEVRAKLPSGQGSWPAFWMLPSDDVYGGWPNSGEIDILEAVNLKTVTDEGPAENRIYGTLHYGYDWPNNKNTGQYYQFPNDTNPADGFHTYAVEWQEGEIRWYADGYLYATQRASELIYDSEGVARSLYHKGWFSEYFNIVSGEPEVHWDNSPFDQNFFMILNLAVGGDWPENVNNTGIDAAAFTDGQQFQIDWVRVYQCTTDTDTGKGCDTIRNGYNDYEDALLIGEAPLPSVPSGGLPVPLTIFSDAPNPYWPIWDCCGGTTPSIETDNEKGAVVQFTIGADPTVMGFNTKLVSSEATTDTALTIAPKPFDASPMQANGYVSFDMKIINPPVDPTSTWKFKIESNETNQEVEIDLITGNNNTAPVIGQWQTYTFPLAQLASEGLDLTAIDVLMIFPAWGTGSGAIYQVDNVQITQDFPELILFEDSANPNWPAWDCCGGSTPTEVVDDDDPAHGNAIQFTIGATPTVMGFQANDSEDVTTRFDASSIGEAGVVQFDMKVITAPNNPDAAWKFKIERDDTADALEMDINESIEGLDPVIGEWQTYTFTLKQLADLAFNLTSIDTLMIFPEWGEGEGAVYLIDNAKIYYKTPKTLALFDESPPTYWTLWDCCAGSNPGTVLEEGRGQVAEFTIGGEPTVVGFLADDDHYFDASGSTVTGGFIRFDMKVVNEPNDPAAQWNLKVESGDASSDISFTLDQSLEGIAPVTGVWQTYTFPLSAMATLDLSRLDVVMVFPDWGLGSGAVFRLDNAKIAFE